MTGYFSPKGGLPPQSALHTGRAVFTEAYCVIPRGVMSDITASLLPGWSGTRAWILARPMTGFSETFSHYLMQIAPEGGASAPEPDLQAEGVLFVTEGALRLEIDGAVHAAGPGSYAYLPPASVWRIRNSGTQPASLHWIRKRWTPAPGLVPPAPFVADERTLAPSPMPDTAGRWATTRFVDPADPAHDMHVNIVTFEPGGTIPFEETHVMEHGLFVLEGKAAYRLNRDWVEVEAGDFLWLRAFCPQACYAAGPGRFRYLLYKDVNRHAPLGGILAP